jgi:dihydrofolate synthase / folylpolyglutamate synthase
MNYEEAIKYLLSFTDYEKLPGITYTAANYDLGRMEMLLQPLGNPHLGTKTVHLAGTKGKGSTAAMISGILTTAGYKTGLYTSPHLISIRERARIDGKMISEDEFAALVTTIEPIAAEINRNAEKGLLTTFEILTAAIFTYFKQNHVDFQVLEVGLGGRLDATNVARGDICIITSISLDHTEILGDNVEKIAVEKAGIIKDGSTVINFPQPESVTAIIRNTCKKKNAPLLQVGKDITWERIGGDNSAQLVRLKTNRDRYDIRLPLLGDFQMENAAAALLAAEALAKLGNKVSPQDIVQGIGRVEWPGRMQVLKSKPLVIADGAHNAYSMRRAIESIKKYFKFSKNVVILGTSVDKDIDGMVRELAGFTTDIIVTRSTHPRSAPVAAIKKYFEKYGFQVREADNVPSALAGAINEAKEQGLVLVTGSLFIVSEAINYFASPD